MPRDIPGAFIVGKNKRIERMEFMRLRLVKQGDFLGTKCDFYVNETGDIFMSRTQIGYALKYKNPQNAITIIHKRYQELLKGKSVELDRVNLTPSPKYLRNNEKVFMYNERGIYDIVRKSNQPVADEYFEWVFEVIQTIKQNGYYIESEKDDKWLGIRKETKKTRKAETDQIKLFVEYAKAQGSQHADRYYVLLTGLINRRLGIESGGRNKADQRTLLHLKSLETVVELHLATLMAEELSYKEVYQGVKRFIETL